MSLPASWVEVALPQICDLVGGGTPERSNTSYFGGNIPWITPSDVTKLEGIVIYGTQETLTEEGLKNSPTKMVPSGSVLMATRVAVGKVAIAGVDLATNQDFTSLIIEPVLITSEYLARTIESRAGLLKSQSQGSTIKGISRATVERLKFPLPTLPEQQRIVDVLRQAEEVAKAKRSISDQIDQLIKTLYWEYFGAWYTADGLRDQVRISEYVADSQYGVSEAMGEHGSHAVLRMNSITTNGWLNLSDLKYANLSKKDAENTTLQNGDLLFNRTNSKELVGKCAIWRDTKGVFSFASYLIRLRLKEGMLPEYLWATLNSTYGKYRLMNAAKQAVSMSNVSPTDLGRITVPLPPLALQEKFVLLVRQIEVLREKMLGKLELFHELQALVTGRALLGDITSSWREQHSEEIMNAANARNDALRARGARIHTSVVEIPSPEIGIAHSSDHIRTARRWLIEELSEFQRFVLDAMREWKGTLLADNASDLDDFCRLWPIEHERNMHDRAKRALEQLAALGLIAKVALPNDQGDFVTGYRRLRPEEKSRLNDIAVLQASLDSASHEAGIAL
jgi:type I restriction enzyme S subunit